MNRYFNPENPTLQQKIKRIKSLIKNTGITQGKIYKVKYLDFKGEILKGVVIDDDNNETKELKKGSFEIIN